MFESLNNKNSKRNYYDKKNRENGIQIVIWNDVHTYSTSIDWQWTESNTLNWYGYI